MNNDLIPWQSSVSEVDINKAFGKQIQASERQQFAEIANAMQAPCSLHGFIVVIESFAEALPVLLQQTSGEKQETYGVWLEAIERLLQRIQGESIAPDLKSDKHHSYCGSHPLYAVLLRFHHFQIPQHLRGGVFALFYESNIEYWRRLSEGLRERVALALRSTCEGKGFSEVTFNKICQNLNVSQAGIVDSLEDICGRVLIEAENQGEEIRKAPKEYLRILLQLFTGELGKRAGGRGGLRRKGTDATRLPDLPNNPKIPTRIANRLDDEEDEDGEDLRDSLIYSEANDNQREKAKQLGVAPGDTTSGEEAISEEQTPQIPADASMDERRLKQRPKGAADAIARRNQFHATAWDQLNAYDEFVLAKGLTELSSNNTDDYGIASPLLAGAIAATFSRGTPFEYILNTRVVRRKIAEASNHVLIKDADYGAKVAWLISGKHDRITGAKFKPEMAGLSRPIATSSTIELQASGWLAQLIAAADRFRLKQKLSRGETRLFPGDISKYVDAAKKWLKDMRRTHPSCRLTVSRIENCFVQHAMQSPKVDLAESAYAHANIQLIQETPLHYTAVSEERPSHIYRQLWDEIDSRIQKESLAIDGAPLLPVKQWQVTMGFHKDASVHFGSQITPTSNAISTLVSYLKQKIATAENESYLYGNRSVEFHNAYTLYTILFLAYSSGYRAAQDPFPDPRFLDPKTGFLVISDKDFDDAYCTRLIWMPEECVKQLLSYEVHFRRITSEMSLLNQGSYEALYDSIEGWHSMPKRPKNMRRMDDFQIPPYLFFLDERGNCISITPGMIREKTAEAFPFPVNANRHYLRTELVERKCPKDILDAFMGHWHRGREPWGKYSSLSPKGYANTVGPIVEGLLKENGWEAIRSIEA